MTFEPRPKGIRRPKSQAVERDAQPGKAAAARAFKMQVCGTLATHVEAHHALPKSWVRGEAWRSGLRGSAFWAAVYDPRVGVCLSVRAHELHTNRVATIWWEDLPLHLRRYVAERWGADGLVALVREHPNRPPSREATGSRPAMPRR